MTSDVEDLTMDRDLQVLLVEDLPADADMVLWALRQLPHGVRHRRVAHAAAMREALQAFHPDIILSDFSMPGFGGHQALQIAKELVPDVPFMFVSGTIGEEVAIDALQRGAVDYVLKENLRRLPSAIERALRGAADRRERERMQRALAESEVRFRNFVEGSKDWIWECDREAVITYTNPAIAEILGYEPHEVCGVCITQLLVPEDWEQVRSQLPLHVEERRGWRNWRLRWVDRDGGIRVLESTGTPLFDPAGDVCGFRGIDHDITERLQHEAKIRALARIHAVLAAIGNAVLHAPDRARLLSNACRVAVEQGGFKAAGIGELRDDGALHVTTRFGDARVLAAVAPAGPLSVHGDTPYYDHPSIVAFRENRRTAIQDFATSTVAPKLREEMLASGVRSQISLPIGSPPWGLLALYSDARLGYDDEEIILLQRVVDEIDHALDFLAKGERLQYLAYHNPATGLPNGAAFHERLQPLLARAPVALVALEVRRFRYVIASRGKAFADRVLLALGERLRGLATLFAHVEGETFLLAVPAIGSMDEEMDRLEAQLRELEHSPVVIDGEGLHLALRAGIVVAATDATESSEALEASAMTALANAAEADLRVCGYTSDMRRNALRMSELERDLRRAIEQDEFELHYQPKFAAGSRQLAGAEALLRWKHPVDGYIPPAEFIPVLEQTGLIIPVGLWVARRAAATAEAWRRQYDPGFRVAVNVSARELRQRTFLEDRESIIRRSGAGQSLDIEVTESLLMEDIDRVVPVLRALREMGCRIAIDDFGTGYSSLNYLVRLPVDTIKIDRSFVSMLPDSAETVALTTNVISLCHSLGLDVVAEGVEDEAQAGLLHQLHCDVLQGYLLGGAMPEQAFVGRVFARETA